MQEQFPRNLYTLNKAKISPVGQNDTLLIKLSILSVIELIEIPPPMELHMFKKKGLQSIISSILNGDIAIFTFIHVPFIIYKYPYKIIIYQ